MVGANDLIINGSKVKTLGELEDYIMNHFRWEEPLEIDNITDYLQKLKTDFLSTEED